MQIAACDPLHLCADQFHRPQSPTDAVPDRDSSGHHDRERDGDHACFQDTGLQELGGADRCERGDISVGGPLGPVPDHQ